jgi:hypothetical protein
MPSTINADDGVISGSAGVKTSADASGELALQANGSTVATLSASGGARMALSGSMVLLAGSVSAPALTTTGDTNTGIFFPAADTIAFAEGGTEALRLTSTGAIAVNGAANYGSSGQVLTSNGNAPPTWQLPAGLPPVTVTALTSVSAVAGNHYVLTAATAATVTLPTSPVISDTVWITVANGRVDNVVDRNGQNIQGLAENMTLNAPYAAAQLRFSDATEGWVMI